MNSLAELDAEIAAVEKELELLKSARALMAMRRGGAHAVTEPAPAAPAAELKGEVANAGPEEEKGAWVAELKKLMDDGKRRRTSEIHGLLESGGVKVTYAALATWLRRAVQRGDFTTPERGVYRKKKEKDDAEKSGPPSA